MSVVPDCVCYMTGRMIYIGINCQSSKAIKNTGICQPQNAIPPPPPSPSWRSLTMSYRSQFQQALAPILFCWKFNNDNFGRHERFSLSLIALKRQCAEKNRTISDGISAFSSTAADNNEIAQLLILTNFKRLLLSPLLVQGKFFLLQNFVNFEVEVEVDLNNWDVRILEVDLNRHRFSPPALPPQSHLLLLVHVPESKLSLSSIILSLPSASLYHCQKRNLHL